ncbi:MAG: GTPase HflX [bacterium]|nr:MAG: GTPase HflX [bacterium]
MIRSLYTPPSKSPEERAFLVGVTLPKSERTDELENISELALLARTAGAGVAGYVIQNRTRIDGSTYIGEGKIEELARKIYELDVNLVIFDDNLSPAQARNVEERLNVNVIDRTELILDIFARRARTRQAKIQVEIAQLTYALPRLRRLWQHLSRQAGGIGTRGPGETQLEVDRRRVRERIAHLRKELEKVSRGVGERRKRRSDLFNVTIVGYTNAGKSTLLNRLAGSRVLESGRLFSTLDSTTRRVRCPGGTTFLLTDTIGFIRKLPPHLVASFRATLMDVREADLLLQLVDASNPGYEDRITVVNTVLEDVLGGGAGGRDGETRIPTLLVLTKIDLVEDRARREGMLRNHDGAVLLSATRGEGTETLLARIESLIERDSVQAEVAVPPEDGKAIAAIEKLSSVRDRRIVDGSMIFEVRIRRRDIAALERVGAVKLIPHRPS